MFTNQEAIRQTLMNFVQGTYDLETVQSLVPKLCVNKHEVDWFNALLKIVNLFRLVDNNPEPFYDAVGKYHQQYFIDGFSAHELNELFQGQVRLLEMPGAFGTLSNMPKAIAQWLEDKNLERLLHEDMHAWVMRFAYILDASDFSFS